MIFNKLYCPNCNKSLIRLEPFEDGISEFWCDKCNIDIRIEDNNEIENTEKEND